MKNVALKRLIHISDLYMDVCDWLDKQNDEGFFKLTPDVVELFAAADPDWKEMDWLDTMDQFIYAEYLLRVKEGGGGNAKKTATRQNLKNHENQVNLNIRSCEDDFCLELLASDAMVRYCVDESNKKACWEQVVKETAVLLKLYLLNNKTEQSFWMDLLSLNKTLGVINEKPQVRYCLGEDVLVTFDYSPNIPLPDVQTNDFVEMRLHGQMTKFYVEEKTFVYNHPLDKLGMILIRLFK